MNLQEALAVQAVLPHVVRSRMTSDSVRFLTERVDSALDEFACSTCGERGIEDAGEHADDTGHWPTNQQVGGAS